MQTMRARLLALSLALLGAAGAAHGSSSAPWWSAFGDRQLDTLMRAANAATPAAEQAVVEGYVEARLGQVRALLATTLVRTAHRQQALLMDAPAGERRNAALAEIAHRIEAIEATAEAITGERDEGLAELARLSGVGLPRLQPLVAPAEGRALLPSVDAPVPQASAMIRTEQAGRLRDLAASARRVERAQQLVQTRRVEMQAHQARQQLGAEDEFGTLEAYQQFLVETDRLALASGQLALAWAQWLHGSSVRSVATAAAGVE